MAALSPALRSAARDWENPEVIGINKRRSHVPLRSFTTSEQVFDHYRLRSGMVGLTVGPCKSMP